MSDEKKEIFGWWRLQKKLSWFCLNATFSADALRRMLEIAEDSEEKTMTISVKQMRKESEKGMTHYAELNTWRPRKPSENEPEGKPLVEVLKNDTEDNLPF